MFNYRLSVFSVVGLATSACATLPSLPTERGINVNLIVEATKCELRSILKTKYKDDIKDWSAKVSLDLRVLYDNSGGPSATLIVPYYAGAVEVNGAVGGSAQSNRVGHLSYNVAKLKELQNLTCADPAATGIPFSPTSLGLGQWLATAVESVTRPHDYVDLNELTYTLEFIVEQTVSGDVRIRSATGPQNGTADLGGRASAKDSNTLLVSLVPPSPKPRPTMISITNWPTPVPYPSGNLDKSKGPENFRLDDNGSGRRPASVAASPTARRPANVKQGIDPYTQQRLDDLQVKQRLFNSIAVPRSTLNSF